MVGRHKCCMVSQAHSHRLLLTEMAGTWLSLNGGWIGSLSLFYKKGVSLFRWVEWLNWRLQNCPSASGSCSTTSCGAQGISLPFLTCRMLVAFFLTSWMAVRWNEFIYAKHIKRWLVHCDPRGIISSLFWPRQQGHKALWFFYLKCSFNGV